MKLFKSDKEESVIIQALQIAKESYALIRDGSSDVSVQNEMEDKIRIINNFLTWTTMEGDE